MIDLHIHSTNSDGTDSVIEILKKAQDLNLDYISITDHDTCKAYNELKNIDIKKYYTGKIIPGIEIKCGYKKHLIELLGYKIDTNKMSSWLSEFYKDKSIADLQNKYFNIYYENCIKMGLIMNEKNNIKFNPEKDWASVTIYYEIKSHEENKEKLPEDLWQAFDIFSKKYCGDVNYPLYIDKSKDAPTVEETIKAIKKANGLVFLPHLFIYKWAEDKIQFIDEILNNYSIDGIECMHNTFNAENIEYLEKICNERGYYKSGGSDYHGKNKPDIFLGIGKGNLKIPNEYVEEWI